VPTTHFWNNLHQHGNIGKPNNLKFWGNKPKGLNKIAKNRLWSPMPEREEH